MFTGIIETIGRVAGLARTDSGARLVVEAPFREDVAVGESVAVSGCCLTALTASRTVFEADLSPETLARTTLGDLRSGARVNIERALRMGARLSGHVVQGHVDGTTTLLESRPDGEGVRQRWSLAPEHGAFVAHKGSVAIDGVSLTAALLGPGWFEVSLVSHTLAVTTIGERRNGDRANIELDILAKQVVHAAGLADARPAIERHFTGTPWEPAVGYCRALRVGTRILVSGTAPVEPDGSTHAPGDAEAQAQRCCEILLRAVRHLGGERATVVRTRMFVTDISHWPAIARAHAAAFGAHPPVTTMVEVSRLIAPDMLVEIEAEAEIVSEG